MNMDWISRIPSWLIALALCNIALMFLVVLIMKPGIFKFADFEFGFVPSAPSPTETEIPKINQRIGELKDTLQSQIDSLSRDNSIKFDENKCDTKEITGRSDLKPKWSELQCDRGSYMKGIAFTHGIKEDATYQEAVRIVCCPLIK